MLAGTCGQEVRGGQAASWYEGFYGRWTARQEALIREVQEALQGGVREEEVQAVVAEVEAHYDRYYDAIDRAAQHNVLQVLTPACRSPLEKAFLWLGEWRPSVSFQLVYALAGQQVQAELADFLDGIDTPSLASLTSSQLTQLSALQLNINREEQLLSDHMAMLQQSIADQPLLYLAQADSLLQEEEAARSDHGPRRKGSSPDDSLHSAINDKLKILQDLSIKADSLRRRTLKDILSVLHPVQRAQYLLASAQLQVALRHIGERMSKRAATPPLA